METIILIPESEAEETKGDHKDASDKKTAEQVVRRKVRDGKSKASESSGKEQPDKTEKKSKGEHKKKHSKRHNNKIKCCGVSYPTSYNLFSWCFKKGGRALTFKQGAILFCSGVFAGVAGGLLFFKTGGAFAAGVGGLVGVGASTSANNHVKGNNNTVVGAGSNSLINVNQVKGGSEEGADKTHKLTWPGMTEALKLECLKKGMTYVEPATGAWLAYDSMGGGARCMTDIPESMIKGDCEQFYQAQQLIKKDAKSRYELNRLKIESEYQLALKKQQEDNKRNFGGRVLVNPNRRGKRGAPTSAPKFKPQPHKTTPAKEATQKFLNTLRGEDANTVDMTEGLNWLNAATGKK
ncbi:MAG: hypothetical protein ACRC9R_10935 [Enterovibrio sp.]